MLSEELEHVHAMTPRYDNATTLLRVWSWIERAENTIGNKGQINFEEGGILHILRGITSHPTLVA